MPSITINQILAHYGINTKSFVIYNDPLDGGGTGPFVSWAALLQYYYSQGFRIYACIDCSNALSYYTGLYSACQAAGIVMTAPLYPWGYETAFVFNTNSYNTLPDPNEQEYYLQGTQQSNGLVGTSPPFVATDPFALVPALAFRTFPGMCIDSPALLAAALAFYGQLNSAIGLQNMIGISGALESDHPVNYNGAQGAMGGNNMNEYARFVSSSLGLYLKDVNASGLHVDGTQCALWPLKVMGTTPNFSGAATVSASGNWPNITYSGGIIPTVAMALDIYNYHHYTSTPGGATTGQSSSYGQYGGASNALLEERIFQYFQSINPYSFWRTAIPTQILVNYVPNWTNYVTYQGTSSVTDAIAFMQQYPGQIMLPFFNYSNPDDNSSNFLTGTGDIPDPCVAGSTASAGYGVASPATVLYFFNNWIPELANYTPFMEVDNAPCAMESQSTATEWGVLGPQYASIPLTTTGTPISTSISVSISVKST